MVHDADRSNDFADDFAVIFGVRRIADDQAGFGQFPSAADSDDFAGVISDDFVAGFVQHVSAAVDGGQSSEALRQLAQTVKRVNVRRFAVSRQGFVVELDPLDGLETRTIDVRVFRVQSHRVTHEILRGRLQLELVVDLGHGDYSGVNALVGFSVVAIVGLRGIDREFARF